MVTFPPLLGSSHCLGGLLCLMFSPLTRSTEHHTSCCNISLKWILCYGALVIEMYKKNNVNWICMRTEDTCLANFTSYTTESISTRIAGEEFHLLMQDPWELIIHCIGWRIVSNSSIVFHEPHVNVLQVRKRNPPWRHYNIP